ncbi:hypothetical protein [Pseudotabrizicola algicola]|uniref:Dihydrodipicolinate reductase n=1 Tax=Pseudotabrizicola algicola TaxID=2709381 RepID=A0A6B3RID0_9RHOB|nr:hypothetical protein [Pseudotabrizicola algicola]NEX44853.1 hypothetical protein [Pseudotabrizicola algicola]
MLRFGVVLMLWSGPGLAADWQTLTGDQISAALTARVVVFPEGVAQYFLEDGRTIRAGSWGEWRVDSDRYCESWSGKRPICAEVDSDGIDLRFREDSGFVRAGRYGDL